MVELNSNYFQVPNDIFKADLKGIEKLIYIYLCRCSNNGSQAFPSYSKIAESCGISRSSAMRMVRTLEEKGFVKKIVRRIDKEENYSNIYEVIIPSVTVTPPSITQTLPSVREEPPSSCVTPPSVSVEPNKELLIEELPKEETLRKNDIERNTISLSSKNENESMGNEPHAFSIADQPATVESAVKYYFNVYRIKTHIEHPNLNSILMAQVRGALAKLITKGVNQEEMKHIIDVYCLEFGIQRITQFAEWIEKEVA